jgi:hypothetical protein
MPTFVHPSRLAAGVLAFALVALLAPPAVVACSCAMASSFEEYVSREPGAGVAVGQVIRDRGDGSFDFRVDRWYGGQDVRPALILQSGTRIEGNVAATNTCGMNFVVGQRLLFLGGRTEGGQYAPSICGFSVDPATPEGADAERQAAELLGAAIVPQPEPAGTPPHATPGGGADLTVVTAGVGGAVVLLFGAVILLGLRRRRRDPD